MPFLKIEKLAFLDNYNFFYKWLSRCFSPFVFKPERNGKFTGKLKPPNYSDLFNDIAQPVIGCIFIILGLCLAVKSIFNVILINISLLIRLISVNNFRTNFDQLDPQFIESLGMILNGILNILLTPFTWIIKLPIRTIMTIFDFNAHDNADINGDTATAIHEDQSVTSQNILPTPIPAERQPILRYLAPDADARIAINSQPLDFCDSQPASRTLPG